MTDLDDVLKANEAFYRAFSEGDCGAMATIWAETASVTCIHPGWRSILGREKVLASWRDILANPPAIACQAEQVIHHGDAAVVLCEEIIEEAHLVATNIFVLEAGAWRLVHHQASPMAPTIGRQEGPSHKLH